MMEFYYHDISPPSQAVWMTLNMLGVNYEAKEVGLLKGEHKSAGYLKINPMGKVPAIRDGEFTLAESRAIAIYLCEAYEPKIKEGKLYPRDVQDKARVNMLLNVDASCYNKIYDYASIGKMLKHEALDEDKLGGAKEALSTLELLMPDSSYFTGDHPTIADIFILSSVKTLDLIKFDDWATYPKLRKWKNLMEKLPHYEDSMGKYVRKYAEILQK